MSNRHKGCDLPEGFKKKGLTVEVHNNNIESAIRTLKRKVMSEGLLTELRDREYYVRPGEKRRRAMKEAVNRARRQQREDQENS